MPLTHPGIYSGDDGRRRHARSRTTAIRPAATRATPAPRSSTACTSRSPSRTSASPSSRARAIPHVVFAGDENHLVGYPGLPIDLNPYFDTFGESRAGRRRRPARCRAPTTSSSTRAREVRGRPVHVPLLGERHDAADGCGCCRRAPEQIAVSITDAGSGVDPHSITGHRSTAARVPAALRHAGWSSSPAAGRHHRLVVTASDYQELKNMEDVAKIKPNTATLERPCRRRASDRLSELAALGVVLVDRRQRGEIPLDRPRRTPRSPDGRPAASTCASRGHDRGARRRRGGSRQPRPLGCSDEHGRGDEQHDRKRAHARKRYLRRDIAPDRIRWQTRVNAATIAPAGRVASLLTACGSSGSIRHPRRRPRDDGHRDNGVAATRPSSLLLPAERADAGAGTGRRHACRRHLGAERPARRAARRATRPRSRAARPLLRCDRRRHRDGVVRLVARLADAQRPGADRGDADAVPGRQAVCRSSPAATR